MANETNGLIEEIDSFFRDEFSFEAGYKLFGEVFEERDDRIVLKPRPGSNLAAATLEKLNTQASGPVFLAGVSLQFESRIQADFDGLIKRFGQATELPRMHPDQPSPYQFFIRGKNFDGYALVGVAKRLPWPMREVQSLILRRFPSATSGPHASPQQRHSVRRCLAKLFGSRKTAL